MNSPCLLPTLLNLHQFVQAIRSQILSLANGPRWVSRSAWMCLDLAIVYVGLWAAAYLFYASAPGAAELATSPTALLITAAFAAALFGTGAYRHEPSQIQLPVLMRMGIAIVGAGLAASAILYLWDPGLLLPRGVVALHVLVVGAGILGSRALVRLAISRATPPPSPPAHVPSPLTLYDLVERPRPAINTNRLRNALTDRTVLVTGAGGAIGSELMQQLAALTPFQLVGVDMSEYNLYRLQHALNDASLSQNVDLRLADVRNTRSMQQLFQTVCPDIVIHTAAYKHVPMMEEQPVEAFQNNTKATMQLLELSEEYQAEQFLFVSTDKAVQPTSVLGATKRLAEWYVRASTSSVEHKIVRFGNVFGSRGSVVPRFERRLAQGRPIPVTHPDMERYFMSAEEACSLIMHTLLLDSHPVYLFRMGEPLRIIDLAQQLALRWYPHRDPQELIEQIGRRPGEKMTESLAMPHETTEATTHPSILGVRGTLPYSRAELDVHIQHLEAHGRRTDISPAHMRRLIIAAPSASLRSAP